MEILNILQDKQSALQRCGNPLLVPFTVDEINTLSDLNRLRCLKLSVPFPAGFERTTDVFTCAKKILDGDNVYRALEFCVLKNRALRFPVTKVFAQLGDDYE